MAGKEVYTEVEGQRIKLTNLSKVLYPESNISKAEIIAYYLEVAPFMLPHLSGRPLTLIRFPDGIGKKTFYTKNKPSWTPDWIPVGTLSWDEDNTYLIANKPPHLAWLANLAALEIHTMNSTMDALEYPDQFVVDLDPPEEWDFALVQEYAMKIKVYLEELGYHPFGKLSGGKGIHIVIPIIASFTYNQVYESIKNMMKEFIKKNNKYTTLHMNKDRRKGKMLLDIYRNNPGNTTVAPYSLRGKVNAPVSMPLTWSEIMEVSSPQQYTLSKALDYLKQKGNAWANFRAKESPLHNRKPTIKRSEKLSSYEEKRDFSKTTEPPPTNDSFAKCVNGFFVIHLHDASNLHYDLRLGINGVLKSWAIPKGLPIRKEVKRLAIQTEDHPAKYFDFAGTIPEDEYGGGEMWIFDSGEIEWNKQTEKHLKFSIKGKFLKASYSLYRTKQTNWIIELDQDDLPDVLHDGIKPMLADVLKQLPKNKSDYLYEIKWDGIRVMVHCDDGQLRIISRSGRNITDQFPEFQSLKFCNVQHAIFDAELVCLDDQGKPIFADIISRMHRIGNIESAIKSKPVYLYMFDCIYIDGKLLTSLPYTERRALMKPALDFGNLVRESEVFEDGRQILDAAKAMSLEGIMAKKKKGKYTAGARTDAWKKIKFRQTIECSIIGYTKGKGDRSDLFGALHLAIIQNGIYKYVGKVGTGFDHQKMQEISEQIKLLNEIKKPIKESVDDEQNTTWIESLYFCEVQYASITNKNTLREPVFVKMWPRE